MKKVLALSALSLMLSNCVTSENTPASSSSKAVSSSSVKNDFEIGSLDFKNGDTLSTKFMFNGFGCNGQNLSPELHWSNLPAGTKSIAIQVHDPDAPTGGAGWWHWVAFNIPVSTQSIAGGTQSIPKPAVQSITDFGAPGFGGYCPPAGPAHRYNFTITALDVEKLDLDSTAMPALVGYMINSHKLGKATLTAYGKR